MLKSISPSVRKAEKTKNSRWINKRRDALLEFLFGILLREFIAELFDENEH